MIKDFYIVGKGGQLFYHQKIQQESLLQFEEKIDPSFITAFISAISDFARLIGEGKIRSMVISNNKWSYFQSVKNLIGISISDSIDDDDLIRELFLIPLLTKFVDHYGSTIDNFDGSPETFKNFKSFVDSQYEIFRKEQGKKYNLVNKIMSFSLEGAISNFGLENILLFIRHSLNSKLILIGDSLISQKLTALLQNLVPIQVTTELNEYTDLFPCPIPLEKLKLEKNFVNINDKVAIYDINTKTWIKKFSESAELEKKILKEILKKFEHLTDSDRISIFRTRMIESIEKIPKCVEIIKKYENHPKLKKEFFEFIKDKDEAEFILQNIRRKIGMEIVDLIKI